MRKGRYHISEYVWVKLPNGNRERGHIEDTVPGEYSIRTSIWRTKKWWSHSEIIGTEIDDDKRGK